MLRSANVILSEANAFPGRAWEREPKGADGAEVILSEAPIVILSEAKDLFLRVADNLRITQAMLRCRTPGVLRGGVPRQSLGTRAYMFICSGRRPVGRPMPWTPLS
jgi:hypothetical protein